MRLFKLLLNVMGDGFNHQVRVFLRLEIATAILAGIGFVLLVPTLDALLRGDTALATRWCAAMAAVFVAYAVVAYKGLSLGFVLGSTVSRSLHHRVGSHIVKLPLGWFQPARVGTVGQLCSKGVTHVMGIPAHLTRSLIASILTPLTVVVAMFFFEWRMGLATLLAMPFLILVSNISSSLVAKAEHQMHDSSAEANSRLVEFATHQPVLRAFGRSVEGNDQLDDALVEQRNATRALMLVGIPGMTGFMTAIQICLGAIMIFGASLAIGGTLGVAELTALLILVVRFVEPLIVAADLMAALRIGENSLARLGDLLDDEPLPEPTNAVNPTQSSLRFESVRFGYEPDRPVLRNISFSAEPGTVTALVGPSGSGKTTVTRLLARFWDVDAGSVSIGGVDVREIATEDLMAKLSFVFQDVYLFEGTILDNIRLGSADASDNDVIAAAKSARVDEIVARLPDGWYTQVGEAGSNLSGGERQRVSIARAILKDAPIVLLDEATAALDPANEALVSDALRALSADKTVLVIAHRLQTVTNADQIMVLDNGQIAEVGTHSELVESGGRYSDFWASRQNASGWRLNHKV